MLNGLLDISSDIFVDEFFALGRFFVWKNPSELAYSSYDTSFHQTVSEGFIEFFSFGRYVVPSRSQNISARPEKEIRSFKLISQFSLQTFAK